MTSRSAGRQNCDYCGLPLARSVSRWRHGGEPAVGKETQRGEPPVQERQEVPALEFCCFGCRFAYQVAAEGGAEGQMRWNLMRLGLAIFLTMNVMMFTMALWTEDVYRQDQAALETTAASALHELLRYLCLVLAAPVVLLLGGPLLSNAVREVRAGILSTDLLIVLGVAASFGYSTISVFRGRGHVYFEVGCVVLLGVTLGRWLEATAKTRAVRALETLARLLPDRVCRLVAVNTSSAGEVFRTEDVALKEVAVGDWLRVLPGERIAVDGRVRRSRATVDEQMVTGESHPVVKEHGDPVYSGALNLDGDLVVEVSAPASAGTLQRLIDSVRAAAERRSRVQRLADRIAAWFIPATALLALGTLLVHGTSGNWEAATLHALAVVLIACPCAIGIATPLAMWAAMGRASCVGILFRSGDALTQLAQCHTMVFDKTGTLTHGALRVVQVHHAGNATPTEVRERAAVVAAATGHVVAAAIRRHTGPAPAHGVGAAQTVPGRGVIVPLASSGLHLYLGSPTFMRDAGLRVPALLSAVMSAAEQTVSHTALGWGGEVRALFELAEEVRPNAAAVLASLRTAGLELTGLTGDSSQRARRWEQELGIRFEAEQLPDGKLDAVQRLRGSGPVAMVGDGLNDAPALAAADVGIALGCGADVSREAAEICLLGNDLARLPWARQLALRTVRTIHQNLFWAFAYNLIGMALAACGYLHPAFAAAAMVISSLIVISNSLRLNHFDTRDWPAGFIAPLPLASGAEDVPRSPVSIASREVPEAGGRPARSVEIPA